MNTKYADMRKIKACITEDEIKYVDDNNLSFSKLMSSIIKLIRSEGSNINEDIINECRKIGSRTRI